MQIGTKIIFGVGVCTLLLGILLIGLGISSFEEISDFEVNDVQQAELKVIDEDGYGDFVFSFFLRGEYLDNDKDGFWDHCDDIEITVIQKPLTADWDEGHDGDFYFQANYEGSENCRVDNGKDNDRPGFVRIGSACLACYSGTFEFQSSKPVYVQNDDFSLDKVGEGIVGWLGGSACICCGVIILILGGLWYVLIEDDAETSTVILSQVSPTQNDDSNTNTEKDVDAPYWEK